MSPAGLKLVRLGAGFVGFALLASLWASPDRTAGLPWFLIAMVGVIVVLAVAGGRLAPALRGVRPVHVAASSSSSPPLP